MTNHFTQEEAVALAKQSQGPKSNGVITAYWLDMDFAALTRLCNAAVDAKLAKAGAHGDGNRCEHGVWAADHCYRCEATHPQASEPAPSTAVERATFSQENYDATFPSSAGRKRLQEFDLRGLLAAKLTCWHRLTEKESDELVALLQSDARPVGELTDEQIGKAWSVAEGEHNASASVKRRITRAILKAAHKIGGQG